VKRVPLHNGSNNFWWWPRVAIQ